MTTVMKIMTPIITIKFTELIVRFYNNDHNNNDHYNKDHNNNANNNNNPNDKCPLSNPHEYNKNTYIYLYTYLNEKLELMLSTCAASI